MAQESSIVERLLYTQTVPVSGQPGSPVLLSTMVDKWTLPVSPHGTSAEETGPRFNPHWNITVDIIAGQPNPELPAPPGLVWC